MTRLLHASSTTSGPDACRRSAHPKRALVLDTVHDRTIRVVLRTIFATGLWISEPLHLTAPQIDSSRMVVRVLGEGHKERLVPLSSQLLEGLRAYWRETRPTQWMFPGKDRHPPLNAATVQKACNRGLSRRGSAPDQSTHSSPLSYHATPGPGGRHPNDPSLAGPSSHRDHASLHARNVGGSA